MRGLLASSIGVTCAVALALPLAPPATAAATTAAPAASAAASPAPSTQPRPAAYRAAAPDLPGSTQSLPLAPLAPLARARARSAAPGEQGLPRRDVRPFSLVGVVWDDPDVELHGRVQVRTRAARTGTWSDWQDVETHQRDHGADAGTAERTSGHLRGATAPLWVGDSDGVEVRVRGEAGTNRAGGAPALPAGLRLELVDPGAVDRGLNVQGASGAHERVRHAPVVAPRSGPLHAVTAVRPHGATAGLLPEASDASSADDLVALGATEIPELTRRQTEDELRTLTGAAAERRLSTKPYIGPRPRIVTRRGWGANESLRAKQFVYTKKVKAAFVHHTASGNNYKCSQAPSLIRGIYRYHVKSMGWRDIGYNFLVDKCGNVYEGRAGGVTKPVLGAHTLGFNSNSMGIAVIGSFGSRKPPAAAVKAVAGLAAWKLGLFGANPRGKTYLKSAGGNLYRKGKNVRLNVISGHRDGFATECPGRKLYGKLGSARSTAARLQGR